MERAASRIAKSEIKKSLVWYTPRRLIAAAPFIANDGAVWEAHGRFLRVPEASMLGMNAGTLWHARFTDFGELFKNNVNSAALNTLLANHVRCTYMRSKFELSHTGQYALKVGIFLVSVSGAALISEEETIPNLEMVPFDFNNLTYINPGEPRTQVDYNFRILAKKQVTLPAGRLFSNSRNISWDKDGADYTVDAQTTPTHTTVRKHVTLNKYFKGLGKRFLYTGDPGEVRSRNEEIYLCLIADGPIIFTCCMGAKIRLDKPDVNAQKSLPAH